MATNNAKLKEVSTVDILADDSPPAAGVVQEGESGTPDIDYSSDTELILSWDGFIDHESGIKMYRIGFERHCLTPESLTQTIMNMSLNIYETSLKSLKVRPKKIGKYYTTVVAFNNAMEPSISVCSDGIILDGTIPEVTNITLEHAKTTEVLGCYRNETFLILENLTAVPLLRTEKCSLICKDSKDMTLISVLPIMKSGSNDTDVADDLCGLLPTYSNDWAMYLPSDKVHMAWNIEDAESQIRDVQIGFASDSTNVASPDIIAYDSVHSHTRYAHSHSGLDRGVEFYIILKAMNKADLEVNAIFGPIIIDETPPLYTGSVAINIIDDFIFCIWDNTTFIETEQEEGISTILFRIGKYIII